MLAIAKICLLRVCSATKVARCLAKHGVSKRTAADALEINWKEVEIRFQEFPVVNIMGEQLYLNIKQRKGDLWPISPTLGHLSRNNILLSTV